MQPSPLQHRRNAAITIAARTQGSHHLSGISKLFEERDCISGTLPSPSTFRKPGGPIHPVNRGLRVSEKYTVLNLSLKFSFLFFSATFYYVYHGYGRKKWETKQEKSVPFFT
jgi:hypothetical protein